MLVLLKISRFTHGLARWKKKDRIQLNSSHSGREWIYFEQNKHFSRYYKNSQYTTRTSGPLGSSKLKIVAIPCGKIAAIADIRGKVYSVLAQDLAEAKRSIALQVLKKCFGIELVAHRTGKISRFSLVVVVHGVQLCMVFGETNYEMWQISRG